MKRLINLILAIAVIAVLFPVFLILFVVIKVSGDGPVIFNQQRAGKGGKPFTFYKFRTMRADADPYGASPKSGDDPRLTKVGRFLRESSLDELPQLFNILKGDMSIVGPRPLYISQIDEWDERQKKRLLVKPGLTGLAQIHGRGHLTREEKLELDVQYAENASLWLDIKIICLTIGHIFCKKDIYEKRYSETELTRGEKQSSASDEPES